MTLRKLPKSHDIIEFPAGTHILLAFLTARKNLLLENF